MHRAMPTPRGQFAGGRRFETTSPPPVGLRAGVGIQLRLPQQGRGGALPSAALHGQAQYRGSSKVTVRRPSGCNTSERSGANKMRKCNDLMRCLVSKTRRPTAPSQSAMRRRPWIGAFLGLALLLTLSAVPAKADDQISFGIDWLAEAEYGGYYQALATG